ncbi:ATP-binding protein [Marinomonas ostreistagni]|uniref:histidine kinase n=1 Tax=Marinomonas ostreistagni TaxID=359209 RepID=A0ABS0ZBY3_9GAMM|nr:ATP-binding protein [Marinomonas ostreistagni]MBJ7550718.1 response regulator [Marinomonas ostreistagni]
MRDTDSSLLHKTLWKAIFLPVAFVIFITCIFLLINEIVETRKQFEYLNSYQTEQIADASEYALLFNDRNLINNNIQSLLKQPDIIGVTYYNNQGEEIESIGQFTLTVNLPHVATHEYSDNDDFISIAPIYYNNDNQAKDLEDTPFNVPNSAILADAIGLSNPPQQELLGWVQVTSSTQRIQLKNIIMGLTSFAYFLIATFLAGILSWRYTKKISTPWLNIAKRISLISQNEFEKADLLLLPDEMAKPQEALQHITERLRNYRTELENEIDRVTKETRENSTLLEEKSAQLHIANKEAMESNRLKTQFLANISHEIRTPLNAILGYTNLLKKDELHSQQRSYVETIAQSTNDLLATIGNILDFSKIEAGKTVVLEKEDFNIKDTINDVLHSLSSTLTSEIKDIDLIPVFSEELPDWVKGDKTRLRQILNNLVGNAIKFTQDGTIHIYTHCKAITQKQLNINIQVVDTGCGIDSEKLNQLFKPFSQVDSSHTRSYAGTGLGLVITKKLIEQMNGSIGVSSELGRGSNFFFDIKLEPSFKKSKTITKIEQKWIILEPNTRYRGYLESLFDQIAPRATFCSTIEQFMFDLHNTDENYFGALVCVSDDRMGAEDANELCKYLYNRFKLPCLLLCKPLSYLAQNSQQYQLCHEILQKPVSISRLYTALTGERDKGLPTLNHKGDTKTENEYSHLEQLQVLAVDDTAINLQLLGHWLAPYKINLTLAYSGSEAIELAKKQRFDLILMDIQMPEMDGMETTRRLRLLSEYSEIPIIALTAHALAEEQESILASGMNAYLTKPINEETLLSTLDKWCTSDVSLSQQVAEQLEEVFDLNKALSMAGNRSNAAKDLFEMLMKSLIEDQRLLSHHYQNKDLEKLIATVHRIHGASKYSGTVELTKHANFLETHLKELGFDEVDEVFQDFMESLERLKSRQDLIPWPQASQTPEQSSAHQTN